MTGIRLVPLEQDDREQFILDKNNIIGESEVT